MDFNHTQKVLDLMDRLNAFMDEHIYPNEEAYREHFKTTDNLWKSPTLMDDLKEKAKNAGLWNLFLPESEHGAGLTNLEYAPLAEIMGRVFFASEVFNCNAPDTGNMEVIDRYGSEAQKEQWLKPLLNGEIRSCFSMTEPTVASSDATNIESPIVSDGDEYVINGRKWWSSGAMNEACKIIIFMGKTDPENPNRHKQQSMILVPMDTKGIEIIRPLSVFGYIDQPFGHAEINFDNVRVPKDNIILGEGRGFEIAQGRLGPGRIHHCMRTIGKAEIALELMVKRAGTREAFGKPIAKLGGNLEIISRARIEIDAMRLAVLQAAKAMDVLGNKEARVYVSAIKAMVPEKACKIIDQAIQMHGAAGISQWTPLAGLYTDIRHLRFADGPDEVHHMVVGRAELQKYDLW